SVDILVSNPTTNRLYQLEVKTKWNKSKQEVVSAKLFGRHLTSWIMNEKHESIFRPELLYCFVVISLDTKNLRYFIVPSTLVAKYVREEHQLWLDATPKGKETDMRLFRIGFKKENYKISTPTVEQFEDNWDFKQ